MGRLMLGVGFACISTPQCLHQGRYVLLWRDEFPSPLGWPRGLLGPGAQGGLDLAGDSVLLSGYS